jgi:hypothetical protein
MTDSKDEKDKGGVWSGPLVIKGDEGITDLEDKGLPQVPIKINLPPMKPPKGVK